MRKKILGGIAILAIAAVAAFNVSLSSQASLSEMWKHWQKWKLTLMFALKREATAQLWLEEQL